MVLAGSADGPLKVLLKRFADKPARVHLQRWKPDHPVTISLTLEEFALLTSAQPIIDEQVQIAALADGAAGSTLDVGAMVEIQEGAKR